MQGAGGVGGLLAVSAISDPQSPILYPSYDGNGNIIAWTDSNGATKQRIDYDPFGNVVTREGDSGFVAPAWGFSTKYQDKETGLLYYGYRYYDPVTGRWPSRDPIEERGGVNLFGFVLNRPITKIDRLGLNILPPMITVDEMWDQLISGQPRVWPCPRYKRQVHISLEHQRTLEKNCPCTKENVLEGHLKLVEEWVKFAVQYEDLQQVPIGGEGDTEATSCDTVNGDLFDYLKLKVPGCWTCKQEEGWRDMSRNELPWYSRGGRANHIWVTCEGRDNDGNLVKEAAFDYWRRESDAWGGMDPNYNRIKWPYKTQ